MICFFRELDEVGSTFPFLMPQGLMSISELEVKGLMNYIDSSITVERSTNIRFEFKRDRNLPGVHKDDCHLHPFCSRPFSV